MLWFSIINLRKTWTTRYFSRIFGIAVPLIFQITLESKIYGPSNCYIDFYIIEEGNPVVNQKSEIKECKTFGQKNRLDFGPDWGAWEGWVRSIKTRYEVLSERLNPWSFQFPHVFEHRRIPILWITWLLKAFYK